MARLSQQEALALIKSPKNRSDIADACIQEERLRMHCEPIMQKNKLPSRAYLDYTTWIKSMITADKTARVLSLLNAPFETVATTKSIFDQLGKFFDTQDRFVDVEFTDPETRADFFSFLDCCNEAEFWPTKGMDSLRIGINSFVVCDLPATQNTQDPEPYQYFVDIRNVIDVDLDQQDGEVEYLIFKQDDRTIVQVDEAYYRVFKAIGKNEGSIDVPYIGHNSDGYIAPVDDMATNEFKMEFEVAHDLGYTPAIDFYGTVISGTRRINKRGPVSDVLTKLDFLLFFATIAKYYQLYGPFPIICTWKIKDKYVDDKNAEQTDTGAQSIVMSQYSAYDMIAVDVIDPRKQPRNLMGAGTTMQADPPEREGDFNAFSDGGPVKIIEMNVANLEWVRGYVEYLSNDIRRICTGRNPQVNNAAKNADQIGESLDEQKSILDNIGAQFERVRKFTLETMARLRYGNAKFVSATVDYGSDYFLKDATTLTDEYDTANKAGMPSGYVDSLKRAVITTKFKNNPQERARQFILLDVEPYPDLTWQEMQKSGLDMRDWINYVIKLNFIAFISEFEAEYSNIVTFMAQQDYKFKITFIKQKLQEYGKRI